MKPQAKVESKIFISHSHKDESIALGLKTALEEHAVEAWTFEIDLPFGHNIIDEVKAWLSKVDCAIFLLSENARKSQWVGRELSLALELQKQCGGCPQIIGILCESIPSPLSFELLDYESGQPTGKWHDFTATRNFNFGTQGFVDTLENLVQHLLPKTTFITLESEEEEALMEQSRYCYEELFPDMAERDEFQYIKTWVHESRVAAVNGDLWREYYAVLHIQDYVMGMIYLTAHTQSPWAFGNYFGVRHGWRQYRRAELFIENVIQELQVSLPHLKGILFEVDPTDLSFLAKAAEDSQLLGESEKGAVLSNVRALRRLRFYQRYKALALLQPNGQPLRYWQPAMENTLAAENERELILMVRLFEGLKNNHTDKGIQEEEIKEMLHFIYNEFYADAYGGEGEVEIENYRPYLAEVKARVESQVMPGCRGGKINIQPKIQDLLDRMKRECPEEIAL
jgi:hypothetical protein